MEHKPKMSYIVITSIFDPTESVVAFSKQKGRHLIVVGDRKTPKNWFCKNVTYLPLEVQESSGYELAKILPFDHYSRKMIGYLKAIEFGTDLIIDTDDDNYPKVNWGFPDFENKYDCVEGNRGFVNIYQLFSKEKIWARGLPLSLILKNFELEKDLVSNICKVGVWQGLADQDPDVDAIYRLTNGAPCYFEDREPVVLGIGTISAFNSQNRIFRKELFPLLYLPSYVTFRFTDILRGLVAQPIMWLYGYQLGFTNASVVQKRNAHDHMNDFISEIPMYQHSESVVDLVANSIIRTEDIKNNLYRAYSALLKEKIICDKEMVTLDAWLKDIEQKTIDY